MDDVHSQEVSGKPALTASRIVSLVLLGVVLLAVPLLVVLMGQRTRQEIKAGQECKQPAIPDPSECVGGEWKLFKNEDGCVRFRCEPRL